MNPEIFARFSHSFTHREETRIVANRRESSSRELAAATPDRRDGETRV
jgi:hypothetical protein|tara:strand:- start:59 stop:202 length:144 start_codon:yes stop_codon:yes gene_type:complete